MSLTAAIVMLFSAVSIRAAPAIYYMFSQKTANRLCMLLFLRRHFYKGKKQVPYCNVFRCCFYKGSNIHSWTFL